MDKFIMQGDAKRQPISFAARFGNLFGFGFGRQAGQHDLISHNSGDISAKTDFHFSLTRNGFSRRAKTALKLICWRFIHSF